MTPEAEADLSLYVLTVLDEHVAAMQDIRERLRTGGRVSPGGRRTIALDSITLAETYAERMTRALSSVDMAMQPQL
jgi:hypothetical protein